MKATKNKEVKEQELEVVDEHLKRRSIEKFASLAQEVNEAVQSLSKDEPYLRVDSLQKLHDVSPQWLRNTLDQNKEKMFETLSLPSTLREEYEEKYNNVYERLKGVCDIICRSVRHAVPARWEMADDGSFYLNPVDVEAEAVRLSTIHLGKEAQEYYVLLSDLVENLGKVSQWERAHGFYNFVFGGTPAGEPWQAVFTDYDHFTFNVQKYIELLNAGVVGPKKNR